MKYVMILALLLLAVPGYGQGRTPRYHPIILGSGGGTAGGGGVSVGVPSFLSYYDTDTTVADSPFSVNGDTLEINGGRVGGLAEPAIATDAATKNYVDVNFSPLLDNSGVPGEGFALYNGVGKVPIATTALQLSPSIQFGGEVSFGGNKATSLDPGTAGTDAVNLGQINGLSDSLRTLIDEAGGPLMARKASVGTITKGTPVYVVSYNVAGYIEVEEADASDAAKMPAIGLAGGDLTNSSTGIVLLAGNLTNINTSAYAVKTFLYVDSTGGMTDVRPKGENLIQKIAWVERSNISTGVVNTLPGANVRDIPNIPLGYIWIGGDLGVPTISRIDSIIAHFLDSLGSLARNIATDGAYLSGDDSTITFVGEAGDVIDASIGNYFRGTTTENDTISFTGWSTTKVQIVNVLLTNGGTHTIHFAGVYWPNNGTHPTLTSGAGKLDQYTFIHYPDGRTVGSVVQDFVLVP